MTPEQEQLLGQMMQEHARKNGQIGVTRVYALA
jgi:hypothetical protein